MFGVAISRTLLSKKKLQQLTVSLNFIYAFEPNLE